MKTNVRVDVQLYAFSVSALDGCNCSDSHHGCFILGEMAPSTHWIVRKVNPGVTLNMVMRKISAPPRN
jgi:hypothetical protein